LLNKYPFAVYIGCFCDNISFIDFINRRYQMANDNNNSAMVGALMLIAGGIIGAGAALLFAPQTGKKTRRDIVRYAKKAKHKAEDVVDDFADTISDMVDKVGEKAGDILDQGKDLAHDAKREMLKALEEGQSRLEKQKTRLAKLIS
jgi:gas vesicle protein